MAINKFKERQFEAEVLGELYEELENKALGESSAEIKKRVNAARQKQLERYSSKGVYRLLKS